MNYLILIIVAIVGIGLGAYFARRKTAKTFAPKTADELDDMRVEAREALSERTEGRKKKILEFMKNDANCNIGNVQCEDIEKLLDVSSGTARKYLNELESENKIKQIGNSGRDVYYTLSA